MSCRIRTKLLIPVALLMMAAALYSTLSKEWGRSSPEPPKPLSVDMVEAEPTGKARPTSGMRIGRDGFGTILSAPARHVTVPEKPPAAEAAMQTAEPPVPSQVAGLVRIVARLTPEPPAKEPTLTLEMPPRHFATILLRHGCLKLTEPGKPGEAHVVLPPLSKLYVGDDGFLVIGTPASGDENPRVGEPAWWEGDSRRPLEAGAVARIRAKCGSGPVRLVGHAYSVAASRAAADGAAARKIVSTYGLPWHPRLRPFAPAACGSLRMARAGWTHQRRSKARAEAHRPCLWLTRAHVRRAPA